MQKALLAACLFLALTVNAHAASTVAKVIDRVGHAQATVGGERRPADILLRLSAGDEIRLEPAAMLRLQFFCDGHWETARGPCSIRLAASQAQLVSGARNRLTRGETSPLLNAPAGNLERMGGILQRAATTVTLTMPHALTNTPHFTWKTASRQPCQLTVLSRPDGTELWTTTSSSGDAIYDGPHLAPDTVYSWRVTTSDGGIDTGVTTGFVILSPASLREVEDARAAARKLIDQKPDDVAPYVLLLDFYAENYMLEEAIQAGLEAVSMRPRDAGLHAALARLYRELPDNNAAGKEQEQARELEAPSK
jgi:hypothetical protein